MGETLNQRRRVLEEALRGVKSFSGGRTEHITVTVFRIKLTKFGGSYVLGDGTLGIRGC